MFSIKIKGKKNLKSPNMVKIEAIFFKTGYNRVPKVLNITGQWKDWDESLQRFKPNKSENILLNQSIDKEILKYQKVAEQWETENSTWTPVELSHYFDVLIEQDNIPSNNVAQIIKQIEARFRSKKRFKNGETVSSNNNAKNYMWLLDSLNEFTKLKYKKSFNSYRFQQITPTFLMDYVKFTLNKGKESGNQSGIRHKLKYLHAVFNYARKNNIECPSDSIFDPVAIYMKQPETESKAVSYETIKRIENIDRSKYNKNQNLYLDLFLFSFYTGGMSNVDVCHLTYDSIQDNIIKYERRKCVKKANPVLTDKARALMGKYKHSCFNNYVMPVFDIRHTTEEAKHKRVEQMTVYVNKFLKKVCKELNITERITWYSARGTFITKMIDAGYSPVLVADMAGNSPNIIYKHYYKNTNSQKLANEINQLL